MQGISVFIIRTPPWGPGIYSRKYGNPLVKVKHFEMQQPWHNTVAPLVASRTSVFHIVPSVSMVSFTSHFHGQSD